MTNTEALPAPEFRIASGFSRSAIDLLIACVLGSAFSVMTAWFANAVTWENACFTIAPTSASISIVLVAYRWRIGIDGDGIVRRRLLRWDRWTWSDFHSGRIKKGVFPYSYRDPTRRLGRRTLQLVLMHDEDRELLLDTLGRIWIPPPAAELPESVMLRYPKDFRFSPIPSEIRIDETGLIVQKRGFQETCAWAEVSQLTIQRLEHDRRDFREMTLTLPDRKFVFRNMYFLGLSNRNWSGVDLETLCAVLETYVPKSNVRIEARYGLPRTVDEAEHRLADLRKQQRWQALGLLPACKSLVIVILIANVIVGLIPPGPGRWPMIIQFLGYPLMAALASFGLYWAIHRFQSVLWMQERKLLERWLANRDAVRP